MDKNTQVEIGENGEVVTISLSRYEELLEMEALMNSLYR